MQHTFEQLNVHHRKLVQHQRVAIQQIFFVARKGGRIAVVPLYLKHPVDGFRLLARHLRHAFRRPTGGRRKQHLFALLLQNGNDGVEGRRFSGAGAAGQNQHALLERLPHRLLLPLGILNAKTLLHRRDMSIDIPQRLRRITKQHQQPTRAIRFGLVIARQKDKFPPAEQLGDQYVLFLQFFEDGEKHLRLHSKHARGGGDQLVLRQAGMAVVRVVPQHIVEPRAQARKVVLLHTRGFCNEIGAPKIDIDAVGAQQKRVGTDQLCGGWTVLLPDP